MRKIEPFTWCIVGDNLYIDSDYFHNDLKKEFMNKPFDPYGGLILGIEKYNNVYLYDMDSCPIIKKGKK